MKEDEEWLLAEMYKEHLKKPEFSIETMWDPITYKMPRDIIEGQDKYNHKRLWYVLDKFDNKGIVEYGTSLATAWLTEKGIELAKKVNK